ncbi:sensor histidine kinase [Nocardioides sp. GCM10027113]|uniref:sensor histidine kinase n=1 Tax=unclassified Nocardioides TaxID=2615069 RepID=UPI0036225E8C
MTPPPRLLAALVALVATACVGLTLALVAVGSFRLELVVVSDLVLATVWPWVGVLVVRAQPRNPVGWVLLAPALLGPYLLAGAYAAETAGAGFLGAAAAWVATWGFAPYFFTVPVLLFVFPDGRSLSPRWRLVLRAVLGVAAVTTLARMVSPVTTDLAPDVTNPLGIESATWLRFATQVGATSLFVVGVPLAVLSVALRMRRAQEPERTQLLWLVLGGLVLAVSTVVPLGTVGDGVGFAVGLVALPLGIGIGMLRHGLFDVELTLNRTVVLGLLTGLVVAAYVLVVYVADAVAPGSRWGVLLVAVAALIAAAARDEVQALVDRWLFGHRHDPYAVVARVGRGVAAASQPVEALQRLVEELRTALRLPYAAFAGADLSVASGEPAHGTRSVPVTALGEPVGELRVGLRSPGERWSGAEEDALAEVADRAGTLAYAAALVTDIAVSRERIVAAREEERRRLRADLHDGVAPALAGTALQLESLARRLEPLDPALAARTLELRDGLRAGVGELRAVVHGLRPPVLDQLGLAGALRQLVAGHESPSCTADVRLDGEPSAALEVAAYAIAAEAFGNALRHSVATRIAVRACETADELLVEVVDDGVGMPTRPGPGVGMVSMRERAAEVGGRLDVVETPGGGTTVRARLPRAVA